jgi:hypothetical protein
MKAQQFNALGSIESSYRILLGDTVMRTMLAKIGKENATKFLKLHASYDALVAKNPKSDPMQAMTADSIPVFKDFNSYVMFLKRVESTLKGMTLHPSKSMHKIITEMLALADKPNPEAQTKTDKTKQQDKTAPSKSEATAGDDVPGIEKNIKYGKSLLHGDSLIHVPLSIKSIELLPYSYPSWEATLDMVTKLIDEKDYTSRIEAELTSAMRAGLTSVLATLPKSETKSIKQLVVEAQQYLMEHNWIRYGLNNVARASYNIATAGIKHRVSTTGLIEHITNTRTTAYCFIGSQLELVLRRACLGILKEASSNVVFAGKIAGLDVLSAACSYVVQEIGRDWLDNLQSKLK